MQKGFAPILILIGIVLAVVIAGGGYYFGKNTSSLRGGSKATDVTISSTPLPSSSVSPSPMDETLTWKTYTSEKLSGLSSPPFSIQYPPNWKLDARREEPDFLTVKLSQEDYTIEISQGPYDGSVCLFKDGPDFNGPAADYRNKDFTEISNKLGVLRRVGSSDGDLPGRVVFNFCSKSSNNRYQNPTSIGKVFYDLPENPDKNFLEEMDKIIETLEEK